MQKPLWINKKMYHEREKEVLWGEKIDRSEIEWYSIDFLNSQFLIILLRKKGCFTNEQKSKSSKSRSTIHCSIGDYACFRPKCFSLFKIVLSEFVYFFTYH